MIVVKEYDQMDSLRELLERRARKFLDKGELDHMEEAGDVLEEEPSDLRTPRKGVRGLKRKRDEDEDLSNEEEVAPLDLKRRRVAANPNEETKYSERGESLMPELMHKGKENIPPVEDVRIFRHLV